MKDLFGNDVGESKYFENADTPSKKPTIKSEFRRMHGFRKGLLCRNCKYFLEGSYHKRKYFKCMKMGLSHSEATDIRKSDAGCTLYEESEGEW